jgi:hypothetical protein
VRDYEKEIAKQAKKNPKAFYRHVNSKLKTRAGISDLRTEDGMTISDDQQKAEAFIKFFSSVYTAEDMSNVPDISSIGAAQQLSSIDITEDEVQVLLRKIQPDKSPGPDNIHPRVLKECAAELAGPLTILFQTSLKEGRLPQEWKEAKVTPIFKKGPRSEVGNYRPVSLTSVCCKVMEKIVRKALLSHLVDSKILSDSQHGFIQGRSMYYATTESG